VTAAFFVLNAGSSTLKFALYQADNLDVLCRGEVANIGREARLAVSGPQANVLHRRPLPNGGDHDSIAQWFIESIAHEPELGLKAAGHRVVHGGPNFSAPVLLDEAILRALAELIPLAPGHQPHNLAAIRAVSKVWPNLPQVACFDTAFHRTQPKLAQLFAVPRELSQKGMIRYGFHGLSYEFIAGMLPEIAGPRAEERVIVAHLGHGASLCAMHQRRSVATTMGFTALDGLMMGTRSGSIDPGLVLHLIQQRGMSAVDVAHMLNDQSGLLGVSGISDDVRVLSASSETNAREALDLFAYRAIREAGSLIAALGGLDILVFTAGIGEHSTEVRAAICAGLSFAGVSLDQERNAAGGRRISGESSRVDVFVLPTNEELSIAHAVRRLAYETRDSGARE
jgi:acetate kinase